MPNLESPPVKDDVIVRESLKLGARWVNWLGVLRRRIDRTADRLAHVALTEQAAAIGVTSFGALAGGLYRVTWYARITTPDTVSSELTVTIGWTDGGVAMTGSGALMNGNTTTTFQSVSAMVRIDRATALVYATTYATVGAEPMRYSLEMTVELVAD